MLRQSSQCTGFSHVFAQNHAVTRSPRVFVPPSRLSPCCSMTKLKRIGRAVLTESSFSYAGCSIFNYHDGCVLTLSFLSDWSFRIYRGHFHFHKPSESTARPTGNAVTQSLHVQISQQLPGSSHAITSNASP